VAKTRGGRAAAGISPARALRARGEWKEIQLGAGSARPPPEFISISPRGAKPPGGELPGAA